MEHLLHRLYGVDAPAHIKFCITMSYSLRIELYIVQCV